MRSPAPKPLARWTEEEAMIAAAAALADAPQAVRSSSTLAEARRQGRHAKTERRLAGIRARRPDLADIIEEDFAWLSMTVDGFARWPVREKIAHWYLVSGVAERGPSIKSTRGTSATWLGVREAAFVLLDWHRAARGRTPSLAWLAEALSRLEPGLARPTPNGVDRARKLARDLISDWRVRD